MVSTPNSTECGPLSVLLRSIVTTGTQVYLGGEVIPSAHMGALPCSTIEQQDFQKVPRLVAAPC